MSLSSYFCLVENSQFPARAARGSPHNKANYRELERGGNCKWAPVPTTFFLQSSETYFERRGVYVFFVSSSAPKYNHVEQCSRGESRCFYKLLREIKATTQGNAECISQSCLFFKSLTLNWRLPFNACLCLHRIAKLWMQNFAKRVGWNLFILSFNLA